MARRKNKKFIDPRYFMDEKTEVLNEGVDPGDRPAGGADSLKKKKADCKGKWMTHGMKGFDGPRGWHGYCEEKKIDEGGCGDHEPHGIEMVAIGDEEAPMEDEEDSPEGLANELLSVAQRIADMLGQDSSVSSIPDDQIPMMEEKGDDKWTQKVDKSIERRGTEGVCTGKNFGSKKCPPGSKRYNLAKTFRKMAKDRKK